MESYITVLLWLFAMHPFEDHHLNRVEGFVCPVILGSSKANWTQGRYQRIQGNLDGMVLLMHHLAQIRETGILYQSKTWERSSPMSFLWLVLALAARSNTAWTTCKDRNQGQVHCKPANSQSWGPGPTDPCLCRLVLRMPDRNVTSLEGKEHWVGGGALTKSI